MAQAEKPVIGVIGGTGALGAGVAWRLARAGHAVLLGSRDATRAQAAAAALADALADRGAVDIRGLDNRAAAEGAGIVFMTVPAASQLATLEDIRPALAGKIVIDATVPLVPPKVARVQLPPEGSAAVRAQAMLGEDVRVVSALHNIAAAHLGEDHQIDCDVLVCGDKKEAREVAVDLITQMGLRAWHAGPLANSAAAEALTSVLIFMNRHYGMKNAGIRIVGE